jgi:hypothetical protein
MSEYEDRMKDYVDVAERLRIFKDRHPEGSLQPLNPHQPYDIITLGDKTFIVYVAAAYRTPDDARPGVGSAWEPLPGTTPYTRNSELMVAETSAWGRAIVAALAADSKRVASLDEVRARRQPTEQLQHPSTTTAPTAPPKATQSIPSAVSGTGHPLATQPQINAIKAISKALGKLPPAGLDEISKGTASILIEDLKKEQMEQG